MVIGAAGGQGCQSLKEQKERAKINRRLQSQLSPCFLIGGDRQEKDRDKDRDKDRWLVGKDRVLIGCDRQEKYGQKNR
ncbi:MAG: hypothetical protein F6J93_10525 [Oscillatoria sp. SIO1A7]|nr:hypothetical protein [Oscillatoria sp. SIO1A7]